MEKDDEYLQKIDIALRRDLPQSIQACIKGVHSYPSLRCTYSIGKRRMFIRVRDEKGGLITPCALRHVLMHELAHIVNHTIGHDAHFHEWFQWFRNSHAGNGECPQCLPDQYNPCKN